MFDCRVCCTGTNFSSSGAGGGFGCCHTELLSSWKSCTDETFSPIELSREEQLKFSQPVGSDEKLTPLSFIWAIRNEVACFQHCQGVSLEPYGFLDLITDVFCKLYVALTAVCHLCQLCVTHITDPIITLFSIVICVIRFILDGVLAVAMKEDKKNKVLQLVIFSVQLIAVLMIMHFTIGSIMLPLVNILSRLINTMLP